MSSELVSRLADGVGRRVAWARSFPYSLALRRAKRHQHGRFDALAGRFAEIYHEMRHADISRFTIGMWDDVNARLERELLPRPPFAFLSHPIISGQMVMTNGGRFLDTQVALLETRYPRERLARILEEDSVGEPLLQCPRFRTSHNSVHHLYHLARFWEATGRDPATVPTVVEWGGGYGNLAKLFLRLRPESTYTIIDTALFTSLQWIYLSTVLGPERVQLITRPDQHVVPERINLVPVHLVETTELSAEMFISTWALSESSAYAQDHVIAREWFGARHLLLTFAKVSFNSVPNPNRLGPILAAQGATVLTAELQPADFYAFR